jgi:hypothetical protein
MISGRRRSVIFFTVFGICLVALAVTLNISWVVLNWRLGVLAVFGVVFFLLAKMLESGGAVFELSPFVNVRSGIGVRGRWKLVWQTAVAILAALYLWNHYNLSAVNIPLGEIDKRIGMFPRQGTIVLY